MNLRILCVIAGAFLPCLCCLEPGVDAAGRTSGSVVTTGTMSVARFDRAAVLLPTGRVLIVGGIERNGVIEPSAELFDPATGHFKATGRPRTQHGWGVTATLLEDGRVLVAGGSTGCDSPCYSASAELYDPAKGTFTKTGDMTVPRAEVRAIRLRTGDVLLVGGTAITEDNPVLTAELYRPSSGTFTPVGTSHLTDAAQVMLLNDGKALVVGSSGADLHDPLTRHFTSAGVFNKLKPRVSSRTVNNLVRRVGLERSTASRRVVETNSRNGSMNRLPMPKFVTNRWSKFCVSTYCPESESRSIFRGSENIMLRSSSIMKIR